MKLDPSDARHVLRQCDFGALATHSARLPGYPFVSHVPLALDGAGRPLLLLSRLAEHTKNVTADPRASLMASLPGEDPQAQPRLTLVGELRPAQVDSPTLARYLRYQPDAATYLGFGDFHFYRLEVEAIRLVAGFARAGWLTPGSWAGRPLDEGDEAGLLARLQGCAPPGWDLLGMDWEGLDLRAPAHRLRLRWEGAPLDEEALVTAAGGLLSAASGQAD